ncbi:MAG: hypothetical protein HC853_13940 [Anaerolineae bacterium]|nr:hypothetical protein [Anaerolineae bacterium]
MSILTNAAYLGHWAYQGVITKWNHHQPIVPLKLFMRVFNRLSGSTLDGEDNEDYQPVRQVARPALEEERTDEYPMCSMFLRNAGDAPNYISTFWQAHLRYYLYQCTLTNGAESRETTAWVRKAATLDAAVSRIVKEKLATTFTDQAWKRSIDGVESQFRAEERLKTSQIDALQATLDNLVQSLSVLKSAEMVKAVEDKFQQTQIQRDELQRSLNQLRQESSYIETLYQLRDEYQPSIANWDHYTNEQKQIVMQAFVAHIELESHGRGSGHLTIYWKDGSQDTTPLRMQHQHGEGWLPEERERLTQLVERNASQLEIAEMFPTRTWSSIVSSARIATGKYLRARPRIIKMHQTYAEYATQIKSVGLLTSDSCSR